jgi:hypothetical protein
MAPAAAFEQGRLARGSAHPGRRRLPWGRVALGGGAQPGRDAYPSSSIVYMTNPGKVATLS